MAASCSLAWADLSPEALSGLAAAQSPGEKLRLLCLALEIRHYVDNTASAVLVDFLYYALLFCEESAWPPEKTSALFSIMKAVFEFTFKNDATADFPQEDASREASFAFFKDKILQHSVESADAASIGLFSVADVEAVAQFVATTFYRHFRAYAYCFSHDQPTENHQRDLMIETPLAPLPLCEGALSDEQAAEPAAAVV
ncbi:flagellar C1a complex subunit C1a-32-domain-containing protein [Pelagophyceae sp. CCMP2097]|nr:flagellar C1a complex subunit C1a-32-domain-containing protein [Pelagophyceae sp. CCMP2097]|mmetsp:Transcript_9589/g.31678  ORF Transcript_9589/g.31678 Transcript_9589/m.31678 type:complete len:199 (-) Transcript_9589:12-608(-)